jgi:NAD(P)-dependent dehydrogenase (short-subunit alcohol dehydrogenase family)
MMKTAVITGAGQGIGRAIALKLAAEGFHAALVGRTSTKLDQVAAEIQAAGGSASAHTLDVTNTAQVEALAAALNTVDVLVNSAGAALIKPVPDITDAEWDTIIDVNLKAPFLLVRALLPHLRLSANASVINIGSKTGMMGVANVTVYTAAKAGLIGLTRSLAMELRGDHIRTVVVCPAPADTPMRWASTPNWDPNTLVKAETIADVVWTIVSLPRGITMGEVVIQHEQML